MAAASAISDTKFIDYGGRNNLTRVMKNDGFIVDIQKEKLKKVLRSESDFHFKAGS